MVAMAEWALLGMSEQRQREAEVGVYGQAKSPIESMVLWHPWEKHHFAQASVLQK